MAKIIQSGGFSGKTLRDLIRNLSKKALIGLAVPLPQNYLPKLVTKANSFAIDRFERKIGGSGLVRAEKGFTLFISSEDMDNIIKLVNLLKASVY